MEKHYSKPTKTTKMVDGDSCNIKNKIFDIAVSKDHTCFGCYFHKNQTEGAFCVDTQGPKCSYDGYSIIFVYRNSVRGWDKYVEKFMAHQNDSEICTKIVAEFIYKESVSTVSDLIKEHKDGWNGDAGKFAQTVSAVLTTVKSQLYNKE